MAKNSKKITLSSERQKEIEKSYVNTTQGRFIFIMMFVNTVIMLIGLLFALYVLVSGYQSIEVNENVSKLADKFLIFGGLITLICLFYYIKYSNSYKPEKKSNTEPKSTKKKSATESKGIKKKSTKKATKK